MNPYAVKDAQLLVMSADGKTLLAYDDDSGQERAPRVAAAARPSTAPAVLAIRLYISPQTPDDEGIATFYKFGAPDTDADGFPDALEDEIGTDRTNQDTDGDGLWDSWEFDGVNDLALHSRGANPRRLDLFVEIDYVKDFQCKELPCPFPPPPAHSHAVESKVKEKVQDAFTHLFSCFRDPCTSGVSVHIENDDEVCSSDATLCSPPSYGLCDARMPAVVNLHQQRKVGIYHWGTSSHEGPPSEASDGIGTDRFVVLAALVIREQRFAGLGASASPVSQLDAAVGLAHELGHNLGLHHGGDEAEDCKPNYPSLMNAAYMRDSWNDMLNRCAETNLHLHPVHGGRVFLEHTLRFSLGVMPLIDENALVERTGLGSVLGGAAAKFLQCWDFHWGFEYRPAANHEFPYSPPYTLPGLVTTEQGFTVILPSGVPNWFGFRADGAVNWDGTDERNVDYKLTPVCVDVNTNAFPAVSPRPSCSSAGPVGTAGLNEVAVQRGGCANRVNSGATQLRDFDDGARIAASLASSLRQPERSPCALPPGGHLPLAPVTQMVRVGTNPGGVSAPCPR